MSGNPSQRLAARRHRARHYAMQALYQWQVADGSPADIEHQFREEYDFDKVDGQYFHLLLQQVPARLEDIESRYRPFLVGREVSELGAVERALLAIGTFELLERVDIPYKVVINEAVILAKKFGAQDSHKFINGVLDPAARQLRKLEIDSPGSS